MYLRLLNGMCNGFFAQCYWNWRSVMYLLCRPPHLDRHPPSPPPPTLSEKDAASHRLPRPASHRTRRRPRRPPRLPPRLPPRPSRGQRPTTRRTSPTARTSRGWSSRRSRRRRPRATMMMTCRWYGCPANVPPPAPPRHRLTPWFLSLPQIVGTQCDSLIISAAAGTESLSPSVGCPSLSLSLLRLPPGTLQL